MNSENTGLHVRPLIRKASQIDVHQLNRITKRAYERPLHNDLGFPLVSELGIILEDL